MAILKVRTYPDPVLEEKCTPVTEFNKELATLLDDMFETMYAEVGVGLAASQVGVTKRLLVVDVSRDHSERWELINPEIIACEGSISSEEGCLSVPDYRDTVKRKEKITVRAQDRYGKDFEIEADELLSICIQHEIDHLDGILFVNRLSRLKRELFKRWWKKNNKKEAKTALKF